jgi:hypothetical protein
MSDDANLKAEIMPFDQIMQLDQCAHTLGMLGHYISSEDPRVKPAAERAAVTTKGFVKRIYEAEDRMEYLLELGFIAMNITANISYTLDRAQLASDLSTAENQD